MSASRPGNMRGPRVKTPLLLLLLLTVLCQYGEPEPQEEGETDVGENGNAETSEQPPLFSGTTSALGLDATVAVEKNIDEEQGSGQGRSLIGAEAGEEDDLTTLIPTLEEGSGEDFSGDGNVEEEESLSPVIILIPVVLVVLIIAMIVCGIYISRRWNKKGRDQALRQEDPYLDGSSTEKVPMPMFEEDVPSVLELEMEELDQWMKKDGETADDSKQA